MRILRPIFLFAHFLAAASAPADSPASAPTSETAADEFIRASCEATRYPERCVSSLNGYAGAVQGDPARLAAVAIGVSLARASAMSVYVANLSRRAAAAAEPRAASAIRDCFSVFRDAVGLIRGSMEQMRRRTAAGGEELRFEMSNVQTWMSAALTNEETCTDGFEGVSDGPVKAEVFDRTADVKEVTSNALALVNNYVNKVVVP